MVSRQMGMVTIKSIYFLYMLLFNENYSIGMLSNKTMSTVEVVNKIKELYKKIPFFMKQGIMNWNQCTLKFENGSSFNTISGSKNISIGRDYNLILLYEFSRMPYQEDIYTSIIPLVTSSQTSKLFIESRPNGACFFHKLVLGAEGYPNDKNMFNVLRTYWWQRPGRDETWKLEEMKKCGSEGVFYEQYEMTIYSIK